MQNSKFESRTSFDQGDNHQGHWQSRHHYQRTRQGHRESYAYAQAQGFGNENNFEVITETNTQDDVIFQVSPDGTIRLLEPRSTYSYSSSRSGY